MAEWGKGLEVFAPVEHAGGGALRRMLELAIEGAGLLPSAKKYAGDLLARRGDPEAAIDTVIRNHVLLAGAQGFVTNLGGLAALPLTLPTNFAGVAMVQMRMVASIAHLRAYDVDDPRVRTAVMLCLLGDGLLGKGAELPASPLVVATAPVFNAALDQLVAEKVLAELAAQVGGRRATSLIARRIPVLGGVVGASTDSFATFQLGAFARSQLLDRRPHA